MNSSDNETYGALARRMRSLLTPHYGAGEADAMVRLIFAALKDWDRTQMIINADLPASDRMEARCAEILPRLEAGEPIQYILGEARFYGMDLKVTPATLIPRPETEELVDIIVKEAGDVSDLRVLDIGTGSGAIAIALARNLRFPEVTALDISAEAVAIAEENARRLHARIRFERADIFEWTPREEYDIIVSNPPYIAEEEKCGMERNVLDHEPHTALFVPDTDPLLYYRRILSLFAGTHNTRLYFEINPRFAADLTAMAATLGYASVRLLRDTSGRPRFLTCRKLLQKP